MDIIAQFAKAVCNRKISLQEIKKYGYRNPDSVFGVLANEIFKITLMIDLTFT